jgi:hypothetical protein
MHKEIGKQANGLILIPLSTLRRAVGFDSPEKGCLVSLLGSLVSTVRTSPLSGTAGL